VGQSSTAPSGDSGIARRRAAAKAEASEQYLARRGHIVDAATEVFRTKGVASTSIDDIARAAEVDRATLYYYFASKEELFQEVVIEAVVDVMDLAEHIDESSDPPSEKLHTLILKLLTSFAHRYPQTYVYLREDVQAMPELNLPEMQRRFEAVVTNIIREGIEAGEFRSDVPPRLASYAIQGMLAWTHRWFDPDGLVDPEDVAEAFTKMAVDGLRKR
jgi:TetR/AcrR family transcriptional regulator, cholesterol catabolism regulator